MSDNETNVPDWAQEGYDPTATENSSRFITPLYSELLDFHQKIGYNPHVDDDGNPITDARGEPDIPPSETALGPEPAPPPSETAVSPSFEPAPPPSETAVAPNLSRPAPSTSRPAQSAPNTTPAQRPTAPVQRQAVAAQPQQGGMLSKLFDGVDYQSNNRPVIENGQINWGNPDNAADMARASKAMTAMMQGTAPATDRGVQSHIAYMNPQSSGSASAYAASDTREPSPFAGVRRQGNAPQINLPFIADDLSKYATYARAGEPLQAVDAVVFHHTGGHGSPRDIVNVLNKRGLGVQYVMDRDGSIYQTLPNGSRGAHIMPSEVSPITNGNAIGIEMIAKDDDDVTPAQIKSAKQFYAALREQFPQIQPMGHGEINSHKMAREGMSVVDALRTAYGIDPNFKPLRRASPAATASRAEGGRLLQNEHPSHYMPGVGRQVMNEGGVPNDDNVQSALQMLYALEGREFNPVETAKSVEPVSILKPLDENSARYGEAEDVKPSEMPYREQMRNVFETVRPTSEGARDTAALAASSIYGTPMDLAGLVHGAREVLKGRIPSMEEMQLPGGSHYLEQRAKETGRLSEEPSGSSQVGGILGSIVADPLAAAGKLKMLAAVPMAGRAARTGDNAVEAAMRVLPKAEDDAGRALELARGNAPKSDVVSDLTGAFAPENNPIRGGTGLEILEMQRKELSPIEQDKLNDLRAKNPDFARASTFLLPGELKTVIANPAQIEPMMRLLDVIPESAHMASLAKAGAPKQGWYRGSTQALIDVFGQGDAPRFAALLAATSPQTSVESNLMNTLNIWKNWEAAGRPTDPVAIKRVMGQSVQGTKGEDSILDAWVNNSIRALSAEDPRKIVLSGPKVNSFFRNLADDVYRVTNDAWISNATNIDQGLLRLSPTALQLAQGNPGLSPGYLALSARQREGGNMVKMLPSESQETIWSVAMPLMEGARKEGISAREFLQRGLLTPDAIRGTPDFSTLLRERPEYASIIRDMGRGEQLDKMQPFNFPRTLPELTDQDQRYLEKTAATLDELKGRRERESRALVQGYSPENERTFAHMTLSGVPGRGTGVAENLIDAEPGSRANFSSRVSKAFQDQVGHDIINKALNLDTVATVPTTEVWRPYAASNATPTGVATSMAHSRAPEGLLETGKTGYTTSVEVPVERSATGKNPRLPKDVERRLQASATLHGGMTAQLGSPYHALIGDEKGLGTAYRMPKDISAGDYQQNVGRVGALVNEPFALADVGRGVNLFPFDDVTPMTRAEREHVQTMLGAESAQPVKNIAGPNSYIDLSEQFAEGLGSKAVTGKIISALKTLKKDEFAALDSEELRRTAGTLHAMYSTQAKQKNPVREDFLNMLAIMRDSGLTGLQKAYRNPEAFLPAVALTLGVGATAGSDGADQ